MKNQTTMPRKLFVVSLLGLALTSLAVADEVTLAGSTLGQFNIAPYTASSSLLDLVYVNSTFNNSTVGGMLDLGGNASPNSNFNNLGSFSLGMMNANYNGNTFTVQVSFTSPTIIAGGSTTVFNDVISGTVLNGNGGVFIDFDNTPHLFTFANATETGSFSMFVNDVSIAPGQDVSLTAHITGNQEAVPEPITMIGLGIAAVGLLSKRRKS
jgi:hypothetical protein